jgi:hypothetical protein
LQKLDDFKNPTEVQLVSKEVAECLVRFAWQLPVAEAGDHWPSTFEDSLILTNMPWFKGLMEEKVDGDGKKIKPPKGALGSVARQVADHAKVPDLLGALHKLMHDSFNKGDFAASIFEMVATEEPVACPKYIADALEWLQTQLEPNPDLML